MAWFKTDDKLHDHRKTRKALRGGDVRRDPAAMGLWILAGSWCAEDLEDLGNPDPGGWVPAAELDRWADDPEPLAERLVAAGFWSREQVAGEAGYRFHDWGNPYQWTRDKVRGERAAARERMARARAGKRSSDVRPNTEGSSGNPTPTPKSSKELSPSRKRDGQSPADKAGDDFARFWELYPHKVGKQDAAKAWTKAVTHTDVPTIAAGLRNAVGAWIAEGRVKDGRVVGRDHYVPHPATWLTQGRWADEVPLPSMPDQQAAARPSVTLAQCDGTDCSDSRHEWTDGRNRLVCLGGAA